MAKLTTATIISVLIGIIRIGTSIIHFSWPASLQYNLKIKGIYFASFSEPLSVQGHVIKCALVLSNFISMMEIGWRYNICMYIFFHVFIVTLFYSSFEVSVISRFFWCIYFFHFNHISNIMYLISHFSRFNYWSFF